MSVSFLIEEKCIFMYIDKLLCRLFVFLTIVPRR